MGRTVITTGTNSGIGLAIMKCFSEEEDICILAHARKESANFLAKIDEVEKTHPGVQTKITQMVCRVMIRNKSREFVNMASVAEFSGAEGQFDYTASKAALVGMTRILSNELTPYNIQVNAVASGMTNTDMIMQMDSQMRADLLDRLIALRLAKASDIANAVYFLAWNEASFINGQGTLVNG